MVIIIRFGCVFSLIFFFSLMISSWTSFVLISLIGRVQSERSILFWLLSNGCSFSSFLLSQFCVCFRCKITIFAAFVYILTFFHKPFVFYISQLLSVSNSWQNVDIFVLFSVIQWNFALMFSSNGNENPFSIQFSFFSFRFCLFLIRFHWSLASAEMKRTKFIEWKIIELI